MKVNDLPEQMADLVKKMMEDDSNFELSDKVLWHALEHFVICLDEVVGRIKNIEGSCPKINMDLRTPSRAVMISSRSSPNDQ